MRLLLLKLLLFVCVSITPYALYSQSRHTVSGFVYEKGSRETLIGVNIFLNDRPVGTTTNSYGFYSITLPAADSITLVFSYIGYQNVERVIKLNQNIEISVELDPSIELEAVEVRADLPKSSSRSSQMSVMELPIAQVKKIPAFLGEKDALKVIQLMPGVQKGSEGSSGFYVRGGGPDQNLIILDDATVYNAYHLFGFFSLFNGDAIKSIELTKGGFPARYGGRLSSVLDINMKDGNKEQLSGEAGLGLISSRIVLEGPIVKDKASFIVSGRRTYLDALVRPFMPKDQKGGYFFHDLTAKLNWQINPKNRIYLSGYFGMDKFFMKDAFGSSKMEAGLFWDNATSTIRWNSVLSSRLFSNLSLIFSNYRFKLYSEDKWLNETFEMSYRSGIRDLGIKYDFSWHPLPSHTVRFGLTSIWHLFTPSAFVIKDTYSDDYARDVREINALESGLYVEDEIKLFDKGIINAGARLSHYNVGGESKMKVEPRASGSFFLNTTTSIKASYAQMNQHIHLLTSTGIGLPTDLWVPATKDAPSQDSWQVALGLARDIPKYSTTLTVEGYYKESENVISYKEGASFLMFDDPATAQEVKWEDNITNGIGWSYGMEVMAHRKSGRLSGWVGYTLSWTKMQFDELNFGNPFYARYDRRHDISVVGIYELSKNITISSTWVYGTGSAVTIAVADFPANEHNPLPQPWWWQESASDFGPKNSFRMAPYHRLDLGIQFHKKMPKYERTWEFSVYNLYNRRNPFVYFKDYEYNSLPNGTSGYATVLKQVSIFPMIPSFSWTIKF